MALGLLFPLLAIGLGEGPSTAAGAISLGAARPEMGFWVRRAGVRLPLALS